MGSALFTRRFGLKDYSVTIVPAQELPRAFDIDADAGEIRVSASAPASTVTDAVDAAREHEMPPCRDLRVTAFLD